MDRQGAVSQKKKNMQVTRWMLSSDGRKIKLQTLITRQEKHISHTSHYSPK